MAASRDMVDHWLKQIPELEKQYKSARASGDLQLGVNAVREAAKIQMSLAYYYFERGRTAAADGRESDAKWARAEGEKRLAKAEEWVAKAASLRENGRFPERRNKAAEEEAGEKEDKESRFLLREKPDVSFDDIAGLDEAKEQIRVRMVYPLLRPDLAQRYGVKQGGGILLYGPPGTGKTMLAKAVASEVDAAFYSVKPSEIMSKWVGESEQNIAKLFEEARANPLSIVFIDEVEALVPPRQDDSPAVMKRLVPQILAELEGIGSHGKNPLLFIGATNEPWNLDSAILRPGRFDEKVYIALPDEAARREILRMNLSGKPLVEVDIEGLVAATAGFSGADLRNLSQKTANSVFLEAIRTGEERDIFMADFESTLEKVKPSVSPAQVARFEKFFQVG